MLSLGLGQGGYPPLLVGASNYERKKSLRENNEQYFDCFSNLVDIFLNTFEWVGLPETCNALALERSLLFTGNCLFFRHKTNNGLYHSPFMYSGSTFNFYGEQTEFITTSPIYKENYNALNSVVIKNTPSMFPSWITLDIYAHKIFDNQRILDVYQHTMKRPFLVYGTKDSKVTIEKIMSETQSNEYYLIVNKNNMNLKDFQVLPIPTNPDNLKVMWDNLHNNQDELYKRLGIKTTRNDKAERMVKAEAESADGITSSNINMMLDIRLDACNKINDMFGINISCKIKHETDGEQEIEVDNAQY